MSVISDKLKSLGVPDSVVSSLEEKLGDKLEGELQTSGLKAVAEKVGIDVSSLPDIDLSGVINVGKELMGKDIDGDGKTGLAEAADTLKDMAAKGGLGDAAEKVADMVSEARGVDADGDGKTGITEAVATAKDALTNSDIAGKATASAGGLLAKIKSFLGV
jgi:hypothetical protein